MDLNDSSLNKKTKSLIEKSKIDANKQFQRLAEKTQVLMPTHGKKEVAKTRYSHSIETGDSAELIVANIASRLGVSFEDIDYQYSIVNVSRIHDIGHPPFGHEGATFIGKFFRDKGLEEGFSDNNNNLVVIDKNNIEIRDYTLASVIKYPDKLYEYQKKIYMPILEKAIEQDREWYKKIGLNLKNQKKTIACQIMDEADRNSYVCSDLSDFFCLGNKIHLEAIQDIKGIEKLNETYNNEILKIISHVHFGNKNSIKEYFNNLKNKFNMNFTINENGLKIVDEELHQFREFLNKIEYEFFIKPLQKDVRKENLALLRNFIEHVIENENYESIYYAQAIKNAKSEQEKLRLQRDMVSEVSDWYVVKYNEQHIKNLGEFLSQKVAESNAKKIELSIKV